MAQYLPRLGMIAGPVSLAELGELGARSGDGTGRARVVDVGARKLEYLMDLIREGSHDAQVVVTARRAVSGVDDKDHLGEARAVWQWLVDHVRYVRDPIGREVVQTAARQLHPVEVLPERLAERLPPPNRTGDCDEMGAVTAGAMLRAIGIPVRIALWGRGDAPWQHIFTLAYISERDAWVPVDPTEKRRPFGWLPPFGRWTAFAFDDDGIESGDILVADDSGKLVAAGDSGELGGFFQDVWKGVQSAAGEVWSGIRKALPAVATVAAAQIPGIGQAAAPIVGTLVNQLVNKGEDNSLVMQAAEALQKGNSVESVLTAVAGHSVPVFGPVAAQLVDRFVLDQSKGAFQLRPGESQEDFNARRGALYMSEAQRMAHAAAQQAPAIAEQQTYAHPRVAQLPPQYAPQPGMLQPAFRQAAQADFAPVVFAPPQAFAQHVQQNPQAYQHLTYGPPQYGPPPPPQYGPPPPPQYGPPPHQQPQQSAGVPPWMQRYQSPAPPAWQHVQQQQQQPRFEPWSPWSPLPSPPQSAYHPAPQQPPAYPAPGYPVQSFTLPGAPSAGYAPAYAGLLGTLFDEPDPNLLDEIAAANRRAELAGLI